jgi:hypothetical protein
MVHMRMPKFFMPRRALRVAPLSDLSRSYGAQGTRDALTLTIGHQCCVAGALLIAQHVPPPIHRRDQVRRAVSTNLCHASRSCHLPSPYSTAQNHRAVPHNAMSRL